MAYLAIFLNLVAALVAINYGLTPLVLIHFIGAMLCCLLAWREGRAEG